MNIWWFNRQRYWLYSLMLSMALFVVGYGETLRAEAVSSTVSARRALVEKLYKLPAVRAALDMIAYAETRDLGMVSYQRQYGNPPRFIANLNRHPSMIVCSYLGGKRICSSASGRYQFIKNTWSIEVEELGLSDFSPMSQDLAAINQIVKAGAIDDLRKLDLKSFFEKTGKIWASLPGSQYGQPTRSFNELAKIFKNRYQFYRRRARHV